MRKSTIKMLSLLLAFLMTFTSVDLSAMAANADVPMYENVAEEQDETTEETEEQSEEEESEEEQSEEEEAEEPEEEDEDSESDEEEAEDAESDEEETEEEDTEAVSDEASSDINSVELGVFTEEVFYANNAVYANGTKDNRVQLYWFIVDDVDFMSYSSNATLEIGEKRYTVFLRNSSEDDAAEKIWVLSCSDSFEVGEYDYRLLLKKNSGDSEYSYAYEGKFEVKTAPPITEITATSPSVISTGSKSVSLGEFGYLFTFSDKLEKISKVKIEKNNSIVKEIPFSGTYSEFNKYVSSNNSVPHLEEIEYKGKKYDVSPTCPLVNVTNVKGMVNFGESLEEGIYSLVFVSSKGKEYRCNNSFYVSDKPALTSDVRTSYFGNYACDRTTDYVAMVVYGYNLNDDVVPMFYLDEQLSRQALVYDANDPNCGRSAFLGDGRIYKVRKTAELGEYENIYVKLNSDDVLYLGNSAYTDGEGKAIAEKGVYSCREDEAISLYSSAATNKMWLMYLPQSVVDSQGIKEGDIAELSQSYYNGIVRVYSEKVEVSKDFKGRLYVSVPITSELYISSGRGTVVCSIGDKDIFGFNEKVDAKKITNLSVSKGKWRILDRFDMGDVIATGTAGTNVLDVRTVAKLSEYNAVIIENTDDNGNLISSTVATFTSILSDTITYEDDGEYDEGGNATSVLKGEKIELKAPTKVHYSFDGWYTDSSYKTKITTLTGVGGKNVTLYAKWIGDECTVNFYADDTEGSEKETLTLKYGQIFSINVKMTKKGYSIAGWKDKYGAFYEETENLTPDLFTIEDDKEIDLFAVWEKDVYNIIYNMGGAKIPAGAKTTYSCGDEDYRLPAPAEILGYTFAGWYTDPDFTSDPIEMLDLSGTGDIQLYARLVPARVTVKFDTNINTFGGATKLTNTKPMPDMEVGYGEIFALPANVYTMAPVSATDRTKYMFCGWAINESSDAIYKDKESISARPLYIKDGVLTLYAVFCPVNEKEFNITYNLAYDDKTISDKYVLGVAKKLAIPEERPGYVFKGWIDTAAANNKIVTGITAKDTGDKKYVAVWEEKQYTVSIAPNGGKGRAVNVKIPYTDSIDLSEYISTFTRDGYYLSGWEIGGKSHAGSFSPSMFPETYGALKNGSRITVNAEWTLCDYNITFSEDGISNMAYNYSLKAIELPVPQKEGCKFMGWYLDDSFKKAAGTYSPVTNKATLRAKTFGDLHLFAKWDMPYSIVLYDGSATKTVDNYKIGVGKPVPANPFKVPTGKMFAGWAYVQNAAKPIYPDKAKIAADESVMTLKNGKYILNLYPVWCDNGQKTYKVVFTKGGTNVDGKMADKVFTYGKLAKLPKSTFKRDDAVFDGWLNKANGVILKDGAEICGLPGTNAYSSVVSLEAVWRSDFTIAFDKNADDATLDRTSYDYKYGTIVSNSIFSKIAVPQRAGYTFGGWYTDPSCKRVFKSITRTTQGDITLYAKWTPAKFTVKFMKNVGSGKMRDQVITYGKKTPLAKCAIKYQGYTFSYWYDPKTDTNYSDKEVIADIAGGYPEGGEVVLYPVWKPIIYNIVYVDSVAHTEAGVYITSEKATLKKPSKLGYVFCGWYRDKAFRQPITEIKPGTTGNITVYAKWKLAK